MERVASWPHLEDARPRQRMPGQIQPAPPDVHRKIPTAGRRGNESGGRNGRRPLAEQNLRNDPKPVPPAPPSPPEPSRAPDAGPVPTAKSITQPEAPELPA